MRLVGGHFADRGGGRHKPVAITGYGLSALAKPRILIAHTLAPIGLVLAADRTGKCLRTAPRDALISLSSPPEARGRAFGVHRAMDTAGALLGPLAALLILRATVDGNDAVFTVSFCVAVIGVLVLVLFVPGGAAARHTDQTARRPRPTLRAALALLRRRGIRRICICALLLGLATVSDSFVYLLLQRRLGVPDRWFALLPIGTAAAFGQGGAEGAGQGHSRGGFTRKLHLSADRTHPACAGRDPRPADRTGQAATQPPGQPRYERVVHIPASTPGAPSGAPLRTTVRTPFGAACRQASQGPRGASGRSRATFLNEPARRSCAHRNGPRDRVGRAVADRVRLPRHAGNSVKT